AATRKVTAAGLPSEGRLTFHLSRQRVPFPGMTCPGCSPMVLASTPLNWPAALVPATGARRAWTGSTSFGIAAAAVPTATAATAAPAMNALVPALRVPITIHLLGLAVLSGCIVIERDGLGSARSIEGVRRHDRTVAGRGLAPKAGR